MKNRLICFFISVFTACVLMAQGDNFEDLQIALDNARKENDLQKLADSYFNLAFYQRKENRNPERSFENFTRSQEYYQILEDSAGFYKCNFFIWGNLIFKNTLRMIIVIQILAHSRDFQ